MNDVSFEVKKGESVGIVGRNGSGKSTLRQMICGTVKPTQGYIQVNAKIAALLELGSGFSPDFTGIENIYLNAALMGLKKRETTERLDKILGFADIGEYIYQPVKTYSSGMVVRLAFAVMANVDAELLVVDEALAVGDAFFTQKCMRFIQRFREENSILFVSHDLGAVQSLCDKAILLDKGELKLFGKPKEVAESYIKGMHMEINTHNRVDETQVKSNAEVVKENLEWEGSERKRYRDKWKDYREEAIQRVCGRNNNKYEVIENTEVANMKETYGGETAEITDVNMVLEENSHGINTEITGGELVKITIETVIKKRCKNLIIGFLIKNDKGIEILGDNTYNKVGFDSREYIEEGKNIRAEFIFTMPLLRKGEYSLSASIAAGIDIEHKILHWLNDAMVIRSRYTGLSSGIVGVPMQAIKLIQDD